MGDLACADRRCAVHLSVMTVADVVEPLVRATLGGELPLRVDYWDGSSSGPADGQFRARFASRRALRRLLWAPNELGFARAYVSGDIVIEGDLIAALSMLDGLADPADGPGVHVDGDTRRAIARAALRLGILGPPPRPPREESRLRGRRHSAARDADAIAHHYDVGNDFYRLVLGPSMVYSCAYFEEQPSAAYTLEDAQRAKLDLVARKLGLRPGMRVLDVGCGWGAFVRHAAREYGVTAVGVTVSREQAALAQRLVEDEGLAGQVQIRVQDYRAVDDGPYDAIASIGMAEHVGMDLLPATRPISSAARPRGQAAQPRHRPPSRTPRRRRVVDVVHRPLRLPGRRARAARDDGGGPRGRWLGGARRGVAARALRADAARVGRQPRGGLGPCGGPEQRRPGEGVAALHGRVGAGLRGKPPRGQPGARRAAGERGASGMPRTREALLH